MQLFPAISIKLQRLLFAGLLSFLAFSSIALAFEIFIEPLTQGVLLTNNDQQHLQVADFNLFYVNGMIAISDKRFSAFDPATRLDYSNRLLAPLKVEVPLYCGYLPFGFALMAPFALVPVIPSFYLWSLVSLAGGMSAITFFARRVLYWEKKSVLLFCLALFLSFPSFEELRIGQASWFVLAFTIWYFGALFKDRHVQAGIALALTTVKPQYSVVLLAAALGLKRWKVICFALLAEIFLILLACFTIGTENVMHYGQLLHNTESVDGMVPAMVSLRPIIQAFFGNEWGLRLSAALLVLCGITMSILWKLYGEKGIEYKKWLASFGMPLTLLCSPHSHCHDLLLVGVSALMTISITDKNRPISKPLILWYSLLLLWAVGGYAFFLSPSSGAIMRWPFIALNSALVASAILCFPQKPKNQN